MSEELISNLKLLGILVFSLSAGGCGGSDGSAPPAALPAAASTSVADLAPAAEPGLKRPVESETLPYADVDETLVYGYFAFPADMIEPLPAVLLVHDRWGLNDQIRSTANRLAAEGFMVLAVDLYSGETVEQFDEARVKTIAVLEHPADAEENIRQALAFVQSVEAPSVGIVGWGFGGAWSLDAALAFPGDIDAAVIYYGQVSDDEERLQGLQAPVLGLFGQNDRSVVVASVRDFEDAMMRLRKPVQIKVYPAVGHAFADTSRPNYNAGIADDAWSRMLDFYALNLVPAGKL